MNGPKIKTALEKTNDISLFNSYERDYMQIKERIGQMKYFYTDLLSAAWMAKHHGIIFTGDNFRLTMSHGGLINFIPDKIIVHSDSMHIFFPQEGDMVNCVASHFVGNPDARIIQRNGIAFIWPETE